MNADIIHTCRLCGVQFRDAKHAVRVYCSEVCQATARKGFGFTEEWRANISKAKKGKPLPHLDGSQRERSGERHPRWRGDQATKHTGHTRAGRRFPLQPCEVCGVPPGESRIERHHRDGNTLNNDASNVAFLCPLHHKAEHRRMRANAISIVDGGRA